MYFKQFYLGCLAHASYLIGSEGEAAVVDPQRDIDQYITEAEAQGLKIKYVIETHLHADFVSGHRELAERTGANIVFGEKAGAGFPHIAVKDGDRLNVGKIILRILATPGHTPESISVLVIDAAGQPSRVLTGDALFIGDVGRPDLAGSSGYTPEQMAGSLYDSLHEKLLKLDDETEVYPAHGAGSLCGRNISAETHSTIGEQRKLNYALKPMSKQEFVRMMTSDLPEVPDYFPRDAEINRRGAAALEDLPRPQELTPEEVNVFQQQGGLVLDVRSSAAFGTSHVPGAINISLSGQFASWSGTLIGIGTPIIIVADDINQVDEAVMRLARIGIESVKGYLDGGMWAWNKAGLEAETMAQITVDELRHRIESSAEQHILDVRRSTEYENGHVPGARNLPLAELERHYSEVDIRNPLVVICASGYRSSIAASLLKRRGVKDIYNVIGGTSAWIAAGHPEERQSADSGN